MSTTIHSANPETLTNASVPKTSKTSKEATLEAVASARDSIAETTEEAKGAAQEIARDARDSVTKATDAARNATREQPLLAIAGALAVGVALGLALNRRR